MSVTAKIDNSSLRPRLTLLNHLNYEHLVAGLSGGVVSTLVLQPLDVIKIRFAVNDGRLNSVPQYTGITNAFTTIFKQEGIRGLYRGVTPNLWGAGSSWGLYFLFYNALKSNRGVTDTPPGPLWTIGAAYQAGALTLCFTNPLWVVKTRLCLQYGGVSGSGDAYKGMIDALVKIYRTEGIKGYYKGMVPGIFGVSHGAVQFVVYEELKNAYNNWYDLPAQDKLSPVAYITMAALSKFVAASTTYPYQVVRLRLQNQHYQYNGVLDCIRRTWTFEGWRGFYKGLGTNLVRVTPATMITFLTYENVSHFLKEQKPK